MFERISFLFGQISYLFQQIIYLLEKIICLDRLGFVQQIKLFVLSSKYLFGHMFRQIRICSDEISFLFRRIRYLSGRMSSLVKERERLDWTMGYSYLKSRFINNYFPSFFVLLIFAIQNVSYSKQYRKKFLRVD